MILLRNQPLYSNKLDSIHSRIANACDISGRQAQEVVLLAVSKRQPAAAIKALHSLGLNEFGESYAGEGVEKKALLSEPDLVWHFIGPLQSNKTALVATHYDWIQSLDRPRIADRLSRQRAATMPPLTVLIQVNIDKEPQKSGVSAENLNALADRVAGLPALDLRGLMAIPRAGKPEIQQRQSFKAMRLLFKQLQARHKSVDTLSMGMSDDLENAIVEGSTMIRVGTALFGPREQ